MAKKLEQKESAQTKDKADVANCLIEVMELLESVETDVNEAEMNKVSIKDALGRRVYF